MLKYIVEVDYDVDFCDDNAVPPDIASDFIEAQNSFISALRESLIDSKSTLRIASAKKAGALLEITDDTGLTSYQHGDIILDVNGWVGLYYLLEVDLEGSDTNYTYIWDAIQEAASVGVSISVMGPAEDYDSDGIICQQGYSDGEIDTGFFTLDDPEEAIVHIDSLPETMQLIYNQ